MMTTPEQQQSRNDFSFMGLSEKWIAEETQYLKIYEFEKLDYLPKYLWLRKNWIGFSSLFLLYLILVWVLHRVMRTRQAFDLRRPLICWNVLLAVLSVVTFLRVLPEIIYLISNYGFYRSYCKRDHFNAATLFWYIVFLSCKPLEFFDTAFIILRKQKLTYLHVFHHASVYIATFFGFIRLDPTAGYYVVLNSFVHSIMYTYYAFKAAKFNLPKKLSMAVTTAQLIQFGAAIVLNGLATVAKVSGSEPSCERELDILVFFNGLCLYYLYIFGKFFVNAYMNIENGRKKLQ